MFLLHTCYCNLSDCWGCESSCGDLAVPLSAWRAIFAVKSIALTGILGNAWAVRSWCVLWLQACLYHGFYLDDLLLWAVGYCDTAHRYFALAYHHTLLAPCISLYLDHMNKKNKIPQEFNWGSGLSFVSVWQYPNAACSKYKGFYCCRWCAWKLWMKFLGGSYIPFYR